MTINNNLNKFQLNTTLFEEVATCFGFFKKPSNKFNQLDCILEMFALYGTPYGITQISMDKINM
jgi:hypothetical protein